MAVGRMLNKHISTDKRVSDLSSDTSRCFFTWCIAHLDRDGRVCGDPITLKNIVFPRRGDVDAAAAEGFIREWAEAGLVAWYEAQGDLWLQFNGFAKNQPHLRYEREAPSRIPPPEEGVAVPSRTYSGPTPDLLRSSSGPTPDLVRAMERKGKEEKRRHYVEAESASELVPFPPEKTPSAAVPAVVTRPVYHLILDAFTSQHAEFDFKREGPHVAALEGKCGKRDPPEDFAKAVLVTFWRLTHGEDPWWRKQPFLPSVLNSGGIWPRVLKELENMQSAAMDAETAELIGRLWA